MSGSNFAQFIPLILIFVIFYFFLIRPQQKRVKEHKDMVKNLKRGDEVITSGGIIGIVDRVFEDDRIELNISEGVKVQVIRNTIQGHLKKESKK
ncbi:MAG: preprotein translocase subunit YajC [Candidatus Marinimicrobia bacterium]|nr:preprotein translocase subunit YajC [Candidatus Neomarinimicrobiota bacterium]|tara:strand:- start:6092 stop:6373 length:282 start_codon:yes stop_codon:yes gene_type:complete